MNIYFTAAVTGEGIDSNNQNIISAIKSLCHHLVSGEQIINQKLLNKDQNLSPTEIFSRETAAINKSDAIIAEVTSPSSGVGGEIVYALVQNKPVLALFYQDAENLLSPMIAGNPSDHLYLEHYDDDNISLKVKNFLNEVGVLKKRKGRLIVIDGGDGSGKATQSELLKTYLITQEKQVKYMDFPRYYSSFHGRIVGRFLAGEFGALDSVNPYLASLAYALDRASAKEEMDDWLSAGGYIISNRYATSSMAHQAARLAVDKRMEFIDWIDELEYKVHRIPREDIVVYLYVPWKIGYDLTLKKNDRKYLKTKMDIAEKDMDHRRKAEEMYLNLVKSRKNWVMINCVKNGEILPKKDIHELIVHVLMDKKLI
jgi:dTMP kinase